MAPGRSHLALAVRGEVVALVEHDHVEVWLHGEIDDQVADELAGLLRDLRDLRLPVVVDGSNVTLCASAGLRFVQRLMVGALPVTLRRPSPAMRLALDVPWRSSADGARVGG